MKKFIAVLTVLLVVLTCTFAADGDKLNLKSSVTSYEPKIIIKYNDAVGSENGVDVETSKNIAEEDIEWTFTVAQNGNVVNGGTYARDNRIVTIHLTLGAFMKDGVIATNNQVVQTVTKSSNGTNLSIDQNDTDKKIIATYSGVVDDQDLGTFTCKWEQDSTLPVGIYKATVTLNYTVE